MKWHTSVKYSSQNHWTNHKLARILQRDCWRDLSDSKHNRTIENFAKYSPKIFHRDQKKSKKNWVHKELVQQITVPPCIAYLWSSYMHHVTEEYVAASMFFSQAAFQFVLFLVAIHSFFSARFSPYLFCSSNFDYVSIGILFIIIITINMAIIICLFGFSHIRSIRYILNWSHTDARARTRSRDHNSPAKEGNSFRSLYFAIYQLGW